MKNIRIAAVVSNSGFGKTADNLDRMKTWIKKASENKAAIVCFPELSITGYHVRKEIINAAEPIPGPSTDYLATLAEIDNITILAGMAETDSNGRIYATHVVITPEGIKGVYRKVHLGPSEKELFISSDTIPVFEDNGIKFGIQLCYDAHFPDLSTAMALKGADVIFIPHASPRTTPDEKIKSWMRHLPARAYDNGLFIIACNQCGKNGKGLIFPGVGVVFNPAGEVIQSYTGTDEHMIFADLKAQDLKKIRSHKMRYFLPNRRPEIYLK
ncbi:MAG: nitrilase [Desulfobacteraceae bacterium]|nr:nitrilase [Desulfobacteraceae bacterium]MBC2756462.1 nitrilase [Desulfobacteraceae bacterium]MBC2763592.1 nitrilase [ANME-2 cluster archaeon]